MLFSAVLPSLQGKQEYKFHKKVGCKVCKVFSSKIIVSFTGKSSLNCLSSACAACVVRCARLVSVWQRPSIIEYGQALSPRQNGYTNIYERSPASRSQGGEGGALCLEGGGFSLGLCFVRGGERPSGGGTA